MKKITGILFLIVACSPKTNEKQETFVGFSISEDNWAIYEGKIITDKGIEADVELSLASAAVGLDGDFKLRKSVLAETAAYGSSSQGKYSVTYGLPGQGPGITLTDRPSVVYKTPQKITQAPKTILALMETPELFFITVGSERLIQTDRHFNRKNLTYVLYRRSELFTVEGYVTHQDSTTEFFERNTMENWKVASLAEIDSIKTKYAKLATEPYEGVYLKALAYSIRDTTVSQSNKSLVIKRVLRMEKSSHANPIP